MKTTIEIDEAKLKRVMKLAGLKTRKATIEFALSQAERLGRINRLFAEQFFIEDQGEVIDPSYDVLRMRQQEKSVSDDPR